MHLLQSHLQELEKKRSLLLRNKKKDDISFATIPVMC